AASTVLRATSALSDRCALSVPMQPRNSPSWVRVTNVAPRSSRPAFPSIARPSPPNARSSASRATQSNARPRSVSAMGRAFAEAERGIADHAPTIAGGIAGVAQVEERWHEAAPRRGENEAVDGRRAAGLLVVERRHKTEYCVGALPVDHLRL